MNFTDRFNELVKDLTDSQLADMFSTSQPTIRRWREGKSQPHPFVQEMVFKLLKQGPVA